MNYLRLKPARTLSELAERLKEALAICGPDAEWNGFDDGAVYIHGSNGSKWVQITNGKMD